MADAQTQQGDDDLLSRPEFLAVLRVGKDFLYTETGKSLPVIRMGRRVYMRRGALREWLRRQEAGGAA